MSARTFSSRRAGNTVGAANHGSHRPRWIRNRPPRTATSTVLTPRLAHGIDPGAGHVLPEGICRTFQVMPYAVVDGYLLVAAVDPGDSIMDQVVTDHVAGPLQLVKHTVDEVVAAIDATYPPDGQTIESPTARENRTQLARMLLRSSLVSEVQLRVATVEHSRTGEPLGDILVAQGAISWDTLAAALSKLHQARLVRFADDEIDLEPVQRQPEPLAPSFWTDPVAHADGEATLAEVVPADEEDSLAEVAPADDADDDEDTLAEADPAEEEQPEAAAEAALDTTAHTAPSDSGELDAMLQEVSSEEVPEAGPPSVEALPGASSRKAAVRSRKAGLVAAVLAFIVGAAIWPKLAAIILVGTCGLLLVVAIRRARRPHASPRHRAESAPRQREQRVASPEPRQAEPRVASREPRQREPRVAPPEPRPREHGLAFLESYLQNSEPVAPPDEASRGTTSV